MNEISILGPVQMTTQSQVDAFSDQVIQSVKSGEANPLWVLIQLRALQKASERIIKEIGDNTLTEARLYPGASFEVYGAMVSKVPVRTEYLYDKCSDPELAYLQLVSDRAKEALDKRKEFLKALTKSETIITEDGEKVTINPPEKKQTDGLKITIK